MVHGREVRRNEQLVSWLTKEEIDVQSIIVIQKGFLILPSDVLCLIHS